MFKKDNKVICIEDNAWVKKGCKGIVIQGGDSINSPYVLWESNGVGNKNIRLYVKAKYLQLLEEPKSESLKPEDLILGEKPEENLVGRYIKALVFAPDGGKVKKDEIGLIKEVFGNNVAVDFPSQKRYYASFKRKDSYELMPIGFNPELKEEYSFYVRYEPDFTEDIFNKLVEWCNSKKNSVSDWYTHTENTHADFVRCKYFWVNSEWNIKDNSFCGVDNNSQGIKKQLSLQELKDLIGYKEEPINTYGLSVGDVLPKKVICAWAGLSNNYSLGETWIQHPASFIGDRSIRSFKVINNIISFEVSDTDKVYLKAEGFKEFMENFDKPKVEDKFIVGKWYKNHTYYIKISKITDICLYSKDWMVIKDIKSFQTGEGAFSKSQNFEELIDLSEIQQYLPEGHVDKVNTNTMELTGDWCIKYTIETKDSIKKWASKLGKVTGVYCYYGIVKGRFNGSDKSFGKELTLDEFKRLVLKKGTNSEEFKVGDWLWWISEGVAFKVGIDKKVYSNDKMDHVVITTDVDYYNNHKTLYRRAAPEEIAKAQGYKVIITEHAFGIDPSYPVKPSSTASMQEILAYCKTIYKKGARVRPVNSDGNNYAGEYGLLFEPTIFGSGAYIHGGVGFLYANGKYAEIISSPKQEVVEKYPLVPEECFTFVKPKKKEYPFDEQAYLSKPFNQKLELNLKVKTNKKSKITI